MKTKEELCAFKEEALEQVTGGAKITTEDDPNWPSNPGNHVTPDSPSGGLGEGGECTDYKWDSTRSIARCKRPVTGRTKPECATCPAECVFMH